MFGFGFGFGKIEVRNVREEKLIYLLLNTSLFARLVQIQIQIKYKSIPKSRLQIQIRIQIWYASPDPDSNNEDLAPNTKDGGA